MIPNPPWLAPFDLGLAHMRACEYDEALTSLDEAVQYGGARLAFFASRTEVLSRLRALDAAIDDAGSQTATRVSLPNDAPRLFRRLAALPVVFQAVVLASGHSVEPTDVLATQIDLAKRHAQDALLERNLIDYLPAEMLVEIGRYVVLSAEEPSFALASTLTGVSKRWERILKEDQALWSHHVIYCDLDEAGTAAMVNRVGEMLARAAPTAVEIWAGDDDGWAGWTYEVAELALQAFRGRGSTIRELSVNLGRELGVDQVWSVLQPEAPLLETLLLSSPEWGENAKFCLSSCTFNSLPALRTLVLSRVRFEPAPTSLLPLLRLMPILANLTLNLCDDLHLVHPSIDGTNRIILPCLKNLHIEAHVIGGRPGLPPRINLVAPALESVRLLSNAEGQPGEADKYMDFLFPANEPPNTSNLRVLEIRQPYYTRLDAIQAARLGAQLDDMPLLRDLTLHDMTYDHADILLAALTVSDTSPGVVCPLLERLTLSEPGPANDGLLQAMVISRTKVGRRTTLLRELRMVYDSPLDRPLLHWTVASRGMSPATAAWLNATLETFVPSPTWDGGGDVTLEEEDDEDSSDDLDFHSSVDASDIGSRYNSVSETESEWEESDGGSEDDEEVAADSDASE